MKTKEEILKETFGFIPTAIVGGVYDKVIEAMEAYANLFRTAQTAQTAQTDPNPDDYELVDGSFKKGNPCSGCCFDNIESIYCHIIDDINFQDCEMGKIYKRKDGK
jgi:hypothetical protein